MFSFETPEHRVLVTASSDGFIKMWKLKQDKVSVSTQYKETKCRSYCQYDFELSEMDFLKGSLGTDLLHV